MQSEKKLSFGFSFADEKIKLIDILTENDDFLVASPFCGSLDDSFSDDSVGFRMSAFRNPPEFGIIQQKAQNQLPSDLVQQLSSRPSFHRKSLAWDSEFFDSPGVLDPDELSCINKGFKTADESRSQDMRRRISELKSRPNLDAKFCAEWFEIEPSIYKPKSKKTFDLASKASIEALKKGDRSFRNEAKSVQTSTGKSINKMETTKRRPVPISSPKPPKALGRNISTISKVNSSTITHSDHVLFTKKKPSSQSRSSLINNSGSNAQTPNLLKRKTESRESRLRASLSASMIWRGGERYKNTSPSKGSWSSVTSLSSSVDINKKRSHGSKTHLDVIKSFGGSLVRNDENKDSRLESPLNTPKQYSRIRSVSSSMSAKSFRPSGLRPPSPQIGFFDEKQQNTCHDTTVKLPPMFLAKAGSSCSNTQFANSSTKNISSPNSNKTSRYSWAREKLKSTCSEVAKNMIKRTKTNHTTSSSLVTDQENDQAKKNISCYDVDKLGNLSRCFAAIDLKGEKLTHLGIKRAPLADKTSSCNSGRPFANSIY